MTPGLTARIRGASELGAEKPTRKGPEPLRSRQRGVLEDVDRSPCSKARARSRAQSSNACWGPVAASASERRAESGTSRRAESTPSLRLRGLHEAPDLHSTGADDPTLEGVGRSLLGKHPVVLRR